MIELSDGGLMMRPHGLLGFVGDAGLLSETFNPTTHTLTNGVSDFVFVNDPAVGLYLSTFKRSKAGHTWINRTRALWRAVVIDIPAVEGQAFTLEPTQPPDSIQVGSRSLSASWIVPVGASDLLNVTMSFLLEDDSLEVTISCSWEGGLATHAIDSLCPFPLRVDIPSVSSGNDWALLPNVSGVMVPNPSKVLQFDYPGPGTSRAFFTGLFRNVQTYPNGAGCSMGCWGYWDTTAREGWALQLDQHTSTHMNVCFEGTLDGMLWETYVPQPDGLTAANAGNPLVGGYTFTLCPLEIRTPDLEDGWWTLGDRYRKRLIAGEPYFFTPPLIDRTDVDPLEVGDSMFFSTSFALSDPVSFLETSIFAFLAKARLAAGMSAGTPVWCWGTHKGDHLLDAPYDDNVPEVADVLAALAAGAANGVYFGHHQPGSAMMRPYSVRRWGAALRDNVWLEEDMLKALRVSRRGAIEGETDARLDEDKTGFYSEETDSVASWDSGTLTITLNGTIDDAAGYNQCTIKPVAGGRMSDARIDSYTSTTVTLTTDPFLADEQTAYVPVSLDTVYVFRRGVAVFCPHNVVRSSLMAFLLDATYGGQYSQHSETLFYADVHTVRTKGPTLPQQSCYGAHAGWSHHAGDYLPHPEGGGFWLVAAWREWFKAFRDFVVPLQQVKSNTKVVKFRSEYMDESMLPHIEGAFHHAGSTWFWRRVFNGGLINGVPEEDTNPGFRAVPLKALALPGRINHASAVTAFSNGLSGVDLGGRATALDVHLRKGAAWWLAGEWVWGSTFPMMFPFALGNSETPTRSGGSVDTDPFLATLASIPIAGSINGTYDETTSGTPRTFTDDGAGNLTGVGVTGTIVYATGAISITSLANNVDDSTVVVKYGVVDLDDVDIFDDTIFVAGGGVVNDEVKAVRDLWAVLNQTENRHARRFFAGEMMPPAKLLGTTTLVDLVAYGIWDTVSNTAITLFHNNNTQMVRDRDAYPAVVHCFWRNPDTDEVALYLVNWSNASGTWSGSIDPLVLGLGTAFSIETIDAAGNRAKLSSGVGVTGFTQTLPAFTMLSFILSAEEELAEYEPQLFKLLPRGMIWDRRIGSNLERIVSAMAAELSRVDLRGRDLLRESDFLSVVEMLDEWEQEISLPDECSGDPVSSEERAEAIKARMRDTGGSTEEYLVRLAGDWGYAISIEEIIPARVGDLTRIGDRLIGAQSGWSFAFYVDAPIGDTYAEARVGDTTRIGDRMATWGEDTLECIIDRAKPAHTRALYRYV